MPLVSLSSNALEVLSVDRIGEQYLVVQDTVTLIRMGASPFFSSLVFRMENRMFIVPCFIFVSFKCCTFGWLAKHEWEQAKAFFLCCLGIRWEAQNYYFGFRDDTGKTFMFSEVWNNRWFLMRLKKNTESAMCYLLTISLFGMQTANKNPLKRLCFSGFPNLSFSKGGATRNCTLFTSGCISSLFRKGKRVISSYCSTLNLRCSAHRCMVVSCCKGSELLGTTIISVF